MIDSLKVYDILKTTISEAQAHTMAQAIQQAESEIAMDVKTVFERAFAQFATKGDLKAEIAKAKADLIWWMFGFWVGQVAVTITLIKALK